MFCEWSENWEKKDLKQKKYGKYGVKSKEKRKKKITEYKVRQKKSKKKKERQQERGNVKEELIKKKTWYNKK